METKVREAFEKDAGELARICDELRPGTGGGIKLLAMAAYSEGFAAGRLSALEEAQRIIAIEIESSTGPTGGWLDSPKAVLAAAIRKLKDEPKGA